MVGFCIFFIFFSMVGIAQGSAPIQFPIKNAQRDVKDCQDGKRSPLLTYLNSHSGPAHLPPASWPPEKYILFRVTIWKVTSFSSFVGIGIFGRNWSRGVLAIGTISLNDVKSESQFWNDKIIVSINIIAAIQFWLPDKIWPSGVKVKNHQFH